MSKQRERKGKGKGQKGSELAKEGKGKGESKPGSGREWDGRDCSNCKNVGDQYKPHAWYIEFCTGFVPTSNLGGLYNFFTS